MSKSPRRFQLLSWNLLNDYETPRHPSQSERINHLASLIKETQQSELPVVLYACEGSRVQHLLRIAKSCGLSVVGTPSPYTVNDHMMFAVSPSIASSAEAYFIPFQRQASKFGVLALRLGDQTIIGAHYPWRPLRDTLARHRATDDIIAHLTGKGPCVVTGDLNSMAWMPARKRLVRAGLIEVHGADRPGFPQAKYHGLTFPRLAPKVSIDAMYTSPDYAVTDAQYFHDDASDHPLLSAVLELRT